MNEVPIVERVPIQILLETLAQLYNRGADYIDITANVEGDEHTLFVSVKKDYMDKDCLENWDNLMKENEEKPNIKIKLSDNDLNDLA